MYLVIPAKAGLAPLLQFIELFHFFVEKRVNVFGVNERCVEIPVAE